MQKAQHLGTIGTSGSFVIGRSRGGHLSHVVLEDNIGHFMAEVDRQSIPVLERGAEVLVPYVKAAETRRKTGELANSIKPDKIERQSNYDIAIKIVAEDVAGYFQDQGTLGRHKGKLSGSHRKHIERAGGLTAKRVASKKGKRGGSRYVYEQTGTARVRTKQLKADGSVNRRYKRATYKRTSLTTTKTGKERTVKHGIKPLQFMKKGLTAGWDHAVEVMAREWLR